jgi:hypothetical protein
MQLDQPLDDLVQKARKERSSGQRRGRGRGLGPRRDSSNIGPVRNARRGGSGGGGLAPGLGRPARSSSNLPAQAGEGKIVVSNLPDDVTEAQIRVRKLESLSPLPARPSREFREPCF